jgi:hypothetical protein
LKSRGRERERGRSWAPSHFPAALQAAQKLVDALPRGPHCCNKGVSLVTKAKQNLDNARKAASDCEGTTT